ncbi:MAG: beta-phosphoglucomutase [Clostridia bacterium]|nr:beta-phosphoglucomutase [Clostridia bacterium]
MKGIIFDLDGVLIHTDEFHYRAWKQIADKIGAPFDRERNNLLRGVSRMESLEIILAGAPLQYTAEEKKALAEEKNGVYRELLKTLTRQDVAKEVRETLAKLKENGWKLAIGSSSKNARFILEQVELIDEFDAISDGNNIVNSKPDPEVFIKAAEFLGLASADCYVVEDAAAGIAAANAGGFASVGMGAAAEEPTAQYTLKTFSDLLQIVAGEN